MRSDQDTSTFGNFDAYTAADGTRAQLIDDVLARCEAKADLNAIITPTAEIAREQAAASDAAIADGKARPLEGIPFTIKDNFCTMGVRTTAGSKILENFVPQYESTVTQRLWDAGAVMLGKVNMDEFGMGSSTTSSYFGATGNPTALDLGLSDIVPGGSSGGSAAAVAAGLGLASLGTDTGGSIRQPASFCGIYGMKPSYGLCSRWGIISYASSLDQAGVLARSPRDIATTLNVISGEDAKDSTSYTGAYPDLTANLGQDLKGKKIGIPKEFFHDKNTAHTQIVWDALQKKAAELQFEIVEVSLPNIAYALQAYYVIALSEASSNLARYDGVRYGHRAENVKSIDDLYEQTRSEGFGAEVKRRIMLGTYCLSAGHYDQYYQRACKIRRMITEDFNTALQSVDVLAWPTTPTSAFSAKAHSSDPVEMYLEDVFTVPVNLAGLPAMSVPLGQCEQGLPLGLTIAAGHLQDAEVIGVADGFFAS
ncbi:Asp-tRNA(Asn)/Glu-tRNA(Gln) amidotransferase subunit GatA [Tropicibacter naphthalenivorans]|uniref:Glutamyl-tRNA(Gln) amidotransferase subunit A n=1 Tax=Tropicibacter naphthalenivorans TaxID=441103 RepID=A0A0P1GK22_9RHOB|nr:Asp-tRNA(Asn)/Glu-tRNA(Gln) amidotransferase subunit GatA [Tropicibacter naphthalenivorans]CUH82356.1 Glutamyl-tRNA(Gln) amidotransferase subunit A [Tropicibacter naphthalenivorans]SMD05748.1 aspartyl/glutamyl-tRNA(Asn/Gln) amidotransferase subunit A [Tropicibacter naphthalenivorans]